MEWMSTEKIRRRAEISNEEALNVSIEEWIDKCKVSGTSECVRTGSHYCGLCQRQLFLHELESEEVVPCNDCVLNTPTKNCCIEYEAFLNNRTPENAQAMLNRLYLERGKMPCKKEPKKEEKPKDLRHGDYGCSKHGVLPWIIINGSRIWLEGDCCKSGLPDPAFKGEYKGNLADDLKRNSEDLEEFKIDCCCFSFKAVLGRSGHIDISTQGAWMGIKTAQEIHQKLGQVITTALRREAKKDC